VGKAAKTSDGTPAFAKHASATMPSLKISNSLTRVLRVPFISSSCATYYRIRHRHVCFHMETYGQQISWWSCRAMASTRLRGCWTGKRSGFYPEHFECTKATSTLSASENSDWCLYLPQCISPTQYPARWLLDRLWDKHAA